MRGAVLASEAGYQIRNKFYPFPATFRLLDSVLIRELTGMTWEEFINAMPDDDDPEAVADPTVMTGLIGVAIWQANPSWPRPRVARYVQGISMDEVEAVGMEEEEEAEASPPVAEETPKVGEENSEKSLLESASDSDSTSPKSNQKHSGNLPLVITPE